MKKIFLNLWNNVYVMQFVSLMVTFLLPSMYTINYYGLFKEKETKTVSLITIFILFFVVVRVAKEIKKIFRLISEFFYRLGGAIKKPMLWGLAMILVYQLRSNIDDMIMVTQIWFYLTLIGAPLTAQYDKLYSKELKEQGLVIDKKTFAEALLSKLDKMAIKKESV